MYSVRWFKRKIVVAFLISLVASLFAVTVEAQQYTTQEMQQLVQSPVAVDKAVEAGFPAHEMERIAKTLNRGEVDPGNFNKTIQNAPFMAEEDGDITSVGNFVSNQVEAGLRGEDLAQAIHGKLNSLGIPAGGHDEAGPPPIAKDFIPGRAKEAIERSRPEQAQPAQDAPGKSETPEVRPGGGRPGGFDGPSSTPGGSGGPGGGMPGGRP